MKDRIRRESKNFDDMGTLKATAMQWCGMTLLISSLVGYGKYDTTVPDANSYKFYEWCISSKTLLSV